MTGSANSIIHGDCIGVMKGLPEGSAGFILTDPPYLVNYRDRTGRAVQNDDNAAWLQPAYREMFRVLRPDAFCVTSTVTRKSICSWTPGNRQVSALPVISSSQKIQQQLVSHAISSRAGLPAGQGLAAQARPPAAGRARLDIHWQPPASDPKTNRHSAAPDRSFQQLR